MSPTPGRQGVSAALGGRLHVSHYALRHGMARGDPGGGRARGLHLHGGGPIIGQGAWSRRHVLAGGDIRYLAACVIKNLTLVSCELVFTGRARRASMGLGVLGCGTMVWPFRSVVAAD